MVYLEFNFLVQPPEDGIEILIAELGEQGFESFVEKKNRLLAYVKKKDWNNQSLDEELFILKNPNYRISWHVKEIEQQNWNADWEKNFQPIEINDQCRVRAPFHENRNIPFEIVIEPKMSFGTGHHETTFMMLESILQEDFGGKNILDMGCGTGVLAILSEMRGAKSIDAVDIDKWCVENSIENAQRNRCNNINVRLGDVSALRSSKYDVILANINKNILLKDIPKYKNHLKDGGILLISGFYSRDINAISSKCLAYNLRFEKKVVKNDWVAAKYVL